MKNAKIKFGIIAIMLIIATIFSLLVFAKPNTDRVPATNDKSGQVVNIPAHAVQVADNVFSLGVAQDVDGRTVEGFLIIDKVKSKRGQAKPGTVCGNGICEASENSKKCAADCVGGSDPAPESTCFATFAKGAKWKETEPYITGAGIDAADTEASLESWDSEVSFEIFGARDIGGIADGVDENSPDGKNEVVFENLGPTNTIAETIVWGIFSGNPKNRELVEWDARFNSDYSFGNADISNSTVMDYINIATHEFGHALGLTHPDGTCTEETMYAFADFNETKKRTLETGDIAGVNNLYG
jgi:hypothetical protein